MSRRIAYETIERVVREQERKLTDEDMERLQPFLFFKFGDNASALVDDAFWDDDNENLYRAFVKQDLVSRQWYVAGTQRLDWVTWGRVHMIKPEYRWATGNIQADNRLYLSDEEFASILKMLDEPMPEATQALLNRGRSETMAIRMDEGLYRDAVSILESLGLSFDDYVTIATRQLVIERRMPFDIVVADEEPTEA